MAGSTSGGSLLGRADRLSKFLDAYAGGNRTLKNADDAKLLFEAICSQTDREGCGEKIACSQAALLAVRPGLSFDVSDKFINGPLAEFLAYLSAPAIKLLSNGGILRRILAVAVMPPALWNALVNAYDEKQLTQQSELNFAWLLLELLLWEDGAPIDTDSVATEVTKRKDFLDSDCQALRTFGYRIQHITQAKIRNHKVDHAGPGGRHDNDFTEARKIAIYPTGDELASNDRPYYSSARALLEQPMDSRVSFHLDNQFRLLREDFLADLRESSGSHRPRIRLGDLDISGAHCGSERARMQFCLSVSVRKGLEKLMGRNLDDRREYLKEYSNVLRHNSYGCFIDKDKVISFAKLIRVEDLLLKDPSELALQIPSEAALQKSMLTLKTSKSVEFVLIETAAFAYEPVLRCLQSKIALPSSEQILGTHDYGAESYVEDSCLPVHDIADTIELHGGEDMCPVLGLSKTARLDQSQTRSLVAGLRQSVSLIQGPPGTGKSFLGALLGKALHDNTNENILVICYTNHALDQFLEELLDIGIPSQSMVRLGSRSTQRTRHLSLWDQAPPALRTQENWDAINRHTRTTLRQERTLHKAIAQYCALADSKMEIMEYLEFSDNSDFFEALQVPDNEDGFVMVGEDGKAINETYLIDRWIKGSDPGVLSSQVSPCHIDIWKMDEAARDRKSRRWSGAILKEAAGKVLEYIKSYNACQNVLQEALSQKDNIVIRTKRIVACTATAAAMYAKQLQSAAPGIILVEEAGEILESHILTAMTLSTRQLILIGDHKQLRPKIANYNLTVEKGDGYDLNRSMFERLAMSGFPHTVLQRQHRMCPQISSLVRSLTYPDLLDANRTALREPLRGVRSRVIFIKHEKVEFATQIADQRDQGASISKQNDFEAVLTMSIVKYLAQQGYRTNDQVVLTPYLGQLNLLRQILARDNDPVLNDPDHFDLVRAGVMSAANASQNKRQLYLSTTDNYQGEESDLVIVNLTRSNPDGNIGFMASPERLNVMLSRARKALILIGNPATFIASRKGGDMWKKFFNLLAETNSMFEGLPVRCERHPDREMTLSQPSDFDLYCPDGVCSAPCGIKLSCGLHFCPLKYHRVTDHVSMKCAELLRNKCPNGHVLTRRCADGHPSSCHICDAETRVRVNRQARDLNLEQARQEKQRVYAEQLAELQDEIDHYRRLLKERREQEDQEAQINQRRKDLEAARTQAAKREAAARAATSKRRDSGQAAPMAQNNTTQTGQPPHPSKRPQSPGLPASEGRQDWEAQKAADRCKNEALDKLMELIGLEDVKQQFLEMKAKIDLALRQDLDIGKERFGAALLGDPGTGKTTVARLYAGFLSSVGALPGDHFIETTGAKLAGEGVKGCEKMLEPIKDAGGGAFFVDEAYQLASGAHPGGAAVLDFLLAEVENLTGKVVFILAGYNKHMEKFFAHNPGLPSRFPREFQFTDYQDDDLLKIPQFNVGKRYEGRMKLEAGSQGLHARIVARRLGRGRGKEGFGNARAVETAVAKVSSRQAKRVYKQRKAGQTPDDMLFTKEDLIGPEPTDVLSKNPSWMKLQKMIGLSSVKASVKALMDSLQYNYHRELQEEPIVDFSLNKVL